MTQVSELKNMDSTAPDNLPHKLKKISSEFNADYFIYAPDILVVVPTPGYKDNAESARASVLWQQNFARNLGIRCGMVVVISNLLTQDAECRRIYSEAMLPELFYGNALVVNSLLTRAIGSFFIGLSKPVIPLTLTESIEAGITWLENLKKS